MRKVLPYDASCEDIIVNKDLTFLQSFVRQKLDEGAKPYQNASERAARAQTNSVPKAEAESKPSLNFMPYEAPTKPPSTPFPAASIEVHDAGGATGASEAPMPSGLNVSGPRKWGPSGYNQPHGKPDPPQAPAQEKVVRSEDFSQVHQPSQKTVPKAEPPAAMNEKQKMAAALFSGLGGANANAASASAATGHASTPSAPSPAAKAQTARVQPREKAPEAPASSPVDLLDLDDGGDGAGAPAAPVSQSPSPQNGDMLLLDMEDSGPAPVAVPVQQAPVQPAPLLGPLQVTTAQVAAMWPQLASERAAQIHTSLGSCQEMMFRLQNAVNVSPVEIIGMEGIAAGRVLPGNEPCFLHGKLAPPRLDIKVRCRDAGVAQNVADLCQRSLS